MSIQISTRQIGRPQRLVPCVTRCLTALAIALGYLGVTPQLASAATFVKGGSIGANETWTTGNVYWVQSNVTVQAGVTLSIQGGTIVKFSPGTYLDVFGTLDLQGSAGNKVNFTSARDDTLGGDTNGDLGSTTPAIGDWDAIYLENSLTTFDFAVVRYAHYGLSVYNQTGAAIAPEVASSTFTDNVYGSYLFMSNSGGITSNIHNNSYTHNTFGIGISATIALAPSATPTLANNDFNNTTGYPVFLGSTAFPVYSGNTFSTNAHPAIALGGAFRASGTWPIINSMPYVVMLNTSIGSGVTITLPIGTVIKFERDRYLSVEGTLDLLSTGVTVPTVFTSFWDDVYGGDTNGDGTCPSCTLEPLPGDWNAIYLESSTTDFQYALVRYAAKGVWVYHTGGGDLAPVVSHNTFDRNQYGLYLNSTGQGKIVSQVMNNTFSNQTTGFPIYLDGTAYPVYGGNIFTNNLHPAIGVRGFFNQGGSWPVVNSMPYVVDGSVRITATAVLTLPVNSVLKFNSGTYLDVFGALDLRSNGSTAPTIFTSYKDDSVSGDTNADGGASQPARGDWDAVYLETNGTQFDFATVRYGTHGVSLYSAGGTTITVPITTTTLSQNVYGVFLYSGAGNIVSLIRNNTFDHNTYGLGTGTSGPTGDTSFPVLQNNSFTNNSGFPIYLGGSAFPSYSGNTFTNNTHPAIALGGHFNDSGTWLVINSMPYVVVENTYVNQSATVALPVNSIFKFETDKYLEAKGVLDLQSTAVTPPIVFTSYRDDSQAGDTNADGGATTPARGDWTAVYISKNGTTFDYALLKYAKFGLDIYAGDGSTVLAPTVSHNTFTQNNFGVYLYSGGNDITSLISNNIFNDNNNGLGTATNGSAGYTAYPTLQNNSFTSNDALPIYLGGSAYPVYSGNTFSNNTHPAIGLGGWFNDSGTWPIINNMPYVITDDVFINVVVVTVPAGEVFKFDLGRYLHVYGSLNMQSTGATPPIIFTSYRDDSYLGDTNADGSASGPAAADWKTVWLYSSNTTFDYAVVKYATGGVGVAYAGQPNTNIFPGISHNLFNQDLVGVLLDIDYDPLVANSGKGNITSVIANNTFSASGYGLATFAHPLSTGSSLPTLTDNVFTNLSGFPIYLGGTAFPIYTGNLALNPEELTALSAGSGQAPSLPAEALRLEPSRALTVVGTLAASPADPSLWAAPAAGNVFSNNLHPAIGLAGNFNANGTWVEVDNMPYVVVGDFPVYVNDLLPLPDVKVGVGATVSLPPGLIVKLSSARYLEAFGAFDLLGSSGNPVLFTSYKDDSAGGDTNADGGATGPARGDWRAVFLDSSGTVFDHAVVKYSTQGVQVYYAGPLSTNIFPEIASSYFLENVEGLTFVAYSDGDITSLAHDNVFINNTTHVRGTVGVGAGKLLVTLFHNDFHGDKNGPYGVDNLSTNATITATQNWWGHASGPFHSTLNPAGLGTPVSNFVNFNPWLGSPSQGATTYSILGRVTDDSVGHGPIDGVTVRLNTGPTTVTSAGGYYAFHGLPAGSYTVNASLGGYTFFPTARNVTLPVDATNVDFVGSLGVGPGSHVVFLPVMHR